METLLRFWPILAFMITLFASGLCIAVGLTLWLMSKLIEQDAKRIEMKEAILAEMRDRHHTVMGGMDMRQSILTEALEQVKDKIAALDNRTVRIETVLNGRLSKMP